MHGYTDLSSVVQLECRGGSAYAPIQLEISKQMKGTFAGILISFVGPSFVPCVYQR